MGFPPTCPQSSPFLPLGPGCAINTEGVFYFTVDWHDNLSLWTDSGQCALRPDGTLKDASEIVWYNDKDDDVPMAPPIPIQSCMSYLLLFPPISYPTCDLALPARNPRTQNTACMREIIKAEQEPDDLDLHRQWRHKKPNKHKWEVLSNLEDEPYSLSTGSSDSDSKTESDSSIQVLPDEVHFTPLSYQ